MMQRKNVKSDFVMRLRLRDRRGELIGWPDFDWRAKFRTDSPRGCYVVQCVGGVPTRCFEDKGEICVVFHRHGLMAGQLHVEFEELHPDGVMPDGLRREVTPDPLDVYLTHGKGDEATEIEVELALPLIKGDPGEPFRYEDFTAEQKAELIAPIKEDIDKAITQKQDKLNVSDDFELPDTAELSLTDQAKRQVFIDLWNSRAGKYGQYNSDTGMFELNGLTDIPYSEALNIYNDSFPVCFGTISGSPYNHSYPRGRTLFPIKPFGGGSIANLYAYCHMLVSISLRDGYGDGIVGVSNMANAFYGNNSLRQIITPIKYLGTISAANDAFRSCQALETVYLAIASAQETAFSFAQSPKLSLESLIYMVNNKTSTYTATITVHPKVYAKLTDELIAKAADRMITFATTT